eukprot:comp10123_c0_seq1/m.4959 comp10123_c0_seq1/g.4959  ORF comp10123_c0_seq1/g.4959 comp10123_c0_seq1/m.4959 type:complete len:113 (-) comp10123_c0_seq1:69-407(-)
MTAPQPPKPSCWVSGDLSEVPKKLKADPYNAYLSAADKLARETKERLPELPDCSKQRCQRNNMVLYRPKCTLQSYKPQLDPIKEGDEALHCFVLKKLFLHFMKQHAHVPNPE